MDLLDFIRADAWGDVESVEECIVAKGVPIDDRWLDYSALNAALERRNKPIVKLLLEKNCRVNMFSETATTADTPLHHAVRLGDLEIVTSLLEKGASPVSVNMEDNTPLHLAFIHRNRAVTDHLLASIKKISNYTNFKNKQGLSHFHIACTRSYETLIRRFLNPQIDVEESVSADSYMWAGFTPLHFAVTFKSFVAVKVLLENGAHPRSKDIKGKTPLQLAEELLNVPNHFLESRTYNLKTKQLIHDILCKAANDAKHSDQNCNMMHYLHDAITRNDPVRVRLYINNGWEVNKKVTCETQMFKGFTPLHFAVMYQKNRIVEDLIIQYGAWVNLSDDGKYGTPLDLALDFADASLILVLLQKGAVADKTNILNLVIEKFIDNGFALTDIQAGCIRNLVTKVGCDLHTLNEFCSTALHRVCNLIGHCGDLLEMLLECGADINMKDSSGRTAFQSGLEKRHKKPSDYALLYNHVQKLKAVGLHVDPENERCCEILKKDRFPNAMEFANRAIAEYKQKLAKEIGNMKTFELSEDKSLCDFLLMDVSNAAKYTQNCELKRLVKSYYNLKERYPLYAHIISVQYRSALQCHDDQDSKNISKRSSVDSSAAVEVPNVKRRCTK